MKRLITFLATTLFLLMLVPKTAEAADFYVKKVGTGQMGLYLWTGNGATDDEKPLGEWDGCETNLTGSYKDGDGNIWYKVSTDKVSAGTQIKYIVRVDGKQSADPTSYFTIPSSGIVCIDWNGNSGSAVSSIVDGSDKTFTEMLPNKIRYRVRGSTGAYVIQDVTFDGDTKINLAANKDYEFQISDENGIWYGLNGSASMVVGGANDWYLYANQDDCYLLTLKGGEYTFKVKKVGGNISVTVVYPGVNLNDYKNKLMYRVDGTDDPANFAAIIYSGSTGTAKVQLEKDRTYKFKISNGNDGQDPTWFGSDGTITKGTPTLANLETGKTARIETEWSGEYTFTVSWSGEVPSVTITYPTENIPAYTLRYKVKGSSDPFKTVALDEATHTTATVSLLANTTYEYEISGPNSVWFGDQGNGTMNVNNCINWPFYKNKQCYITTNTAGEYKFTVNWESTEKAVVSVAYPSVKVGKYYLVVPDENVGNTPRAISNKEWLPAHHKAFEMIAGRERNQNLLADDITSVTLKIDGNKGRQLRYDSEGKIKFYIYDETNNQFYQPDEIDYADALNTDGSEYVDGRNVELMPRYRTSNGRDAIGRSRYEIKDVDQDRYYYINKEHATVSLDDNGEQVAYPTVSLTFMFSKYNGRKAYYKNKGGSPEYFEHGNCIYYVDGERKLGDANLLVAFLKPRAFIPETGKETMYYKEHIKGNGVYLVGSLTGGEYLNGSVTTPGEELYYDKTKYKMEPNYWFDGVIDNSRTDIEKADSIVYSCEIKKGGAVWEDFFLSFTTGDVLGSDDMWKPLLRPRVQNQMDAQALEGGIFYYLTNSVGDDPDQQQSLNPLLSEEQKKNYASYRVYFNATYSTYRTEFYDNFCIAGPAVNGKSNDTSKSGTYFDADHRHGMLEETVNGRKCYRYRGEFKKGSTFAFFVNPETSALYYCEDNDNAAVNDNTGDRWHTQAPVGEDGAATGADYPYHNKVAWQTDGSSDINAPGLGAGNAILWTLPDGVYTLRFYNHEGNTSDVDHTKALYTIDKEVVLKNASSTFEVWNEDKTGKIEKTFEYGGLRTFSDDCALMLPLGVKAYYANSIDEEKGRVNLKEVSGNIIPAHCPVIIYDLSMKAGYNSLGRTAVKTINLCPVPGVEKEYTKTLEDMVANEADKVNYLVDLSTIPDRQTIQPEAAGKYNFFMTNQVYLDYDYTKKVSAPLNFWRAKAGAVIKKNYTYLSVDKDIRPVFYTGAQNYVRPDASEDIANSKRNYCFILSFGDVDDDTVVTGITSVNAGDKTADSDAWYTIQGIRIAAPAVPGMYIHNGKKVVLK